MIYPETEAEVREAVKVAGYPPEMVDELDRESLFELAFHVLVDVMKP
ncbi:hypothetical protein [Salinithrix halophila]|uniref:Uncharacterized protein n=1 Tax=Salinithrix halophila TaxID=1485204 RepID=A0ABV8JFE8_9BACL